MTIHKKYDFTDEDGEPLKIQFKDNTGIKLLISKVKNLID